ncbi:hypothetical protein ACHAXT_004920 [Thalassiosira profunda]
MAPDPPKPEISQAVARGDLASVRRVVDAATSTDEKIKTINAARKWVEVNPAYTCEENPAGSAVWHDVTPITIAAIRGHEDVVEYLLNQGADPTLKGCSKDDIELDDIPISDIPDLHMNAFDAASRLNRKIRQCRRTQDLLRMVKPYWKKCVYSGSSAARHKRTVFSSSPLNMEWIADALGQVPPLKEYPLKANDYNADTMVDLQHYLRQRKLVEMQQQNANRAMAPPPAQEVPNPNLVDSGTSGRHRRCFACGELKPEHAYNKNERRRGVEARCISCVATNAGVMDIAASVCTVCKRPKFNSSNAVCQGCLGRMAGEPGKPQPAVKREGS